MTKPHPDYDPAARKPRRAAPKWARLENWILMALAIGYAVAVYYAMFQGLRSLIWG